MRWAAEPADCDAAKVAFEQVAGPLFAPEDVVVDQKPPERVYTKYGSHVPERPRDPMSWSVPAAVAVVESSPFMHMESPHCWWFAEDRRAVQDMTPL